MNDQQKRGRSSPQAIPERLQATLHEAVERLVEERGRALIIIDALDEIATRIDFLPELLPRGAAGILTTRPVDSLLGPLEHRLRAKRVTLEGLLAQEVRAITGVEDEAWNQSLRHRAQGAPLYVREVAARVRDHDGDYKSVDLPASMSAIFRQQHAAWSISGAAQSGNGVPADALQSALTLLVVFEPVAPLSFDLLQAFLERKGHAVSGSTLREMLDGVSTQIEGLDVGRVKLAIKAFAEFVRESVCSRIDMRRYLAEISEWLEGEEDATPALIAAYLDYWTNGELIRDVRQREAAGALIPGLSRRGRADALISVFRLWRMPLVARQDQRLAPVVAALESASEQGSVEASFELAMHLRHNVDAVTRVRELLQTAASAGHSRAKGELASIMLMDAWDDMGRVEGERLLREAALTDEQSRLDLAERLIDGDGLVLSREEGEALLRQAARTSRGAKLILAERLLDGRGLGRAALEGEVLLRDTARTWSVARQELMYRLFDGNGVVQSAAEAERILREDASTSMASQLQLAKRLLDGSGLAADPEQGERLLKDAAVSYHPAKLHLAERLLDGTGLQRSAAEGERLLREVAKEQIWARICLARRLIDGNGLSRSPIEGVDLLRECAESVPAAAEFFAEYLIEDRVPAQSQQDVERLLRVHAPSSQSVRTMLSLLLVDSTHDQSRVAEGARTLAAVARASPDLLNSKAYRLYERAQELSGAGKNRLLACGASLFLAAHEAGSSDGGNNLAYMIRRREAESVKAPPICELLASGLSKGDPFARVNIALCEAAGIQCSIDWQSADVRMGSLLPENAGAVHEWWHALAVKGDPEGHLVVGWLARHGLGADPEGITLAERMNRARAGFQVPSWMHESVGTIRATTP